MRARKPGIEKTARAALCALSIALSIFLVTGGLNIRASIAGEGNVENGTGEDTPAAKLQTSETVRSAMEAIRYAVVINHTLVTHRRMPAAGARQFEVDINAQTARIRKSDDLSPIALAAIAPILDALDEGAAGISKSSTALSAMDGLIKIDEALADYESAFKHPGWKGLQEL